MIVSNEWRSFLYPLGFIAMIPFAARFFIQWRQSEKAKKSILSPSFWIFSLLGNFLLTAHSFIQLQFHVCLIQACNGVLSWRNLDLMKQGDHRCSFITVIIALIGTALFVFFGFLWQEGTFMAESTWFRVPSSSENQPSLSFVWHIVGSFAYFLFSGRFWVQWWHAERGSPNEFSSLFWWMGLVGAALSIGYFFRIGDTVNLIGPVVSIVPYTRNLFFIYKNSP